MAAFGSGRIFTSRRTTRTSGNTTWFLYLYNGKYIFFRGTAGGVHLFSTENFELNVMGRYRFSKLDPDRNAFFEGLEQVSYRLANPQRIDFVIGGFIGIGYALPFVVVPVMVAISGESALYFYRGTGLFQV